MAFQDLAWTQGKDNMGGLVGDLFWVPVEDIDETAMPTLNADGISIDGNITLKALKQFFRIYHTKGTGKYDDNMVGERDGKSFEQMCDFFFPGNEKAVEAFKSDAANTPCVVLCKDSDGNYRTIGLSVNNGLVTLDRPAYMEQGSGTTGAAPADRRGTTFQFKAEAAHPALFYSGTIDEDPGT